MLYVEDDGTIKLTRGDTAKLTVTILDVLNQNGNSEYEVASTDRLIMTVKKSVNDKPYIIKKEVQGSNVIHIKPEDTEKLQFGDYVYDVQLLTSSNDVYTIIEPSPFTILSEVGY